MLPKPRMTICPEKTACFWSDMRPLLLREEAAKPYGRGPTLSTRVWLRSNSWSSSLLSGAHHARIGMQTAKTGTVRVGIGGWVFPPWRGTFYPAKHPQSQELAHASRQV